jgi:hypothetical protein
MTDLQAILVSIQLNHLSYVILGSSVVQGHQIVRCVLQERIKIFPDKTIASHVQLEITVQLQDHRQNFVVTARMLWRIQLRALLVQQAFPAHQLRKLL